MKQWSWVILIILIATSIIFLSGHPQAGGPGDDGPPPNPIHPDQSVDWCYATIEYRDDLIAANKFFLEVKAHPKAQFPKIAGGYAETNVHTIIQLRGVSVPRALQEADTRARPHTYVERERVRFDTAMDYIWSLVQLNKTLRVYNPTVIVEDECVECDIDFFIGGQWASLAGTMLHDEHARPLQKDGGIWDWGSRNVTILNPNVPK